MKISSLLYQRLVSYTGVAAAMVATNNKVAEAQIIYTDVNPDHPYSDWDTSPYQLDVNNDGIVDFEFYNTGYEGSGPTWCGSSSAYVNALGSNEIMIDAKPIDNGFPIDSQQDWDNDGHIVEFQCSWESGGGGYCACHPDGNWAWLGESKFVGLRLHKDNESYYGWIRLRNMGLMVEDFAIQSIPGEPITAGAVGNCDTLQVTVSPADSVHICGLDEINLEADYPFTTYSVNIRWQKDDIDITGAVSKTLIVGEPGIYRAIIDGYGCADTTNSVTVIYNSFISPPTTIIQHLDTLFSSPQSNYIWYKSNIIIPGATNQFYVISENGTYQSRYTDSLNCLSSISNFYATTCANTEVTIDPGSVGVICDNDSYDICFTANPDFDFNFQWLLNGELVPDGTFFCYAATDPGNYTVAFEGYQGCTDTSDVFELIVISLPIPIITQINDSILQSSASEGNQWYFNGVPISGATDQTYIMLLFGMYRVMVTDSNNCSSMSDPFYFYPIGISNPGKENNFIVFALNRQLHVQFTQLPLHSKMMVVDLPGNHLVEEAIDNSSMAIDISNFADGVYFVIVDDGKSRQVKKVFIGE